MLNLLKRWAARLARNEGVAGLIVAMIVAIIAATSFTIYLSTQFGATRDLQRRQAAAAAQVEVMAGTMAYFLRQSPTLVPCPDTDQDGDEDCTDVTGTAAGTIPWSTIGVSRDAAVDPYGRYYTYIAIGDAEAREVCENQQNDYTPTQIEYTGALKDQTTLEVRLTSQSAGNGRYVPFAIISHGPNGLGGVSASDEAMDPAASGSFEETNADDDGPAVVYTGPYSSATATYFDDTVFAPTADQIQKVCEDMSPGGEKNAALTEDFGTGTAISTTKFDVSSSDPPTQSAGRANFTTSNSHLATETTYDFTANVEPVYVAAYWTPGASSNGFSIATRATLSPTGDDFTTGLTFRFYSTLSIRADSAAITTTGSDATYTITSGQQYLLEVYDSGSSVWMRVTQVSDPTNTASIQGTDSSDLTGDQRVVFINGSAGISSLDDLVIGTPMLSLQTGPTSGYAASAAGVNGTATGNLSLEAWIKPRSVPAGTTEATIISQWDSASTTTENTSSFRLYLIGSNFALDLQDTTGTSDAETFNLGFGPTVNVWTHIAVTYNETTRAISAYKDGVLSYSGVSTLDANGVQAPTTYSLAVGADSVNSPPANFFYGNISDVRVWNAARTATQIARCYQKRLPTTSPCSNADHDGDTVNDLVVNWKLDPTVTQGGLSETDVVASVTGAAGTVTIPAAYGPAIAAYFRPISTNICPANTHVGAYRCDFRLTAATTAGSSFSVNIPSNLNSIFAKVWGAGGGGYSPSSRNGGHGGFSRGLIESIDSVDIAGMNIYVLVGGGGTGSGTAGTGAGGGAASFVTNLDADISLSSGGGGGASFSNQSSVTCDGAARCGDGAEGGSAGTTLSEATDGDSTCGGRGGSAGTFGDNPPDSGGGADCPNGGADPTGSTTTGGRGGAGTGGGAGGTGTVFTVNVAGGAGYSATASRVGGGGGGGGYVGGEAGGYDNGTNFAGYGGGGGSGNAPSGVSGASTTVSSAFLDDDCQLDLTEDLFTHEVQGCGAGGNNPITRGWQVGMTVESNDVSADGSTTIQSLTSTHVTLAEAATSNAVQAVDVSGTQQTHTYVQSTGTTDEDYAPSTGLGQVPATYRNPGLGGTSGAAVNGNPGAVILRW